MYQNNKWIPEFKPGQRIETQYYIVKVINIDQEQIYNVEIGGCTAKMTESFLKDLINRNLK